MPSSHGNTEAVHITPGEPLPLATNSSSPQLARGGSTGAQEPGHYAVPTPQVSAPAAASSVHRTTTTANLGGTEETQRAGLLFGEVSASCANAFKDAVPRSLPDFLATTMEGVAGAGAVNTPVDGAVRAANDGREVIQTCLMSHLIPPRHMIAAFTAHASHYYQPLTHPTTGDEPRNILHLRNMPLATNFQSIQKMLSPARVRRTRRLVAVDDAAEQGWDAEEGRQDAARMAGETDYETDPSDAQVHANLPRQQHLVYVNPFLLFTCGNQRGQVYVEMEEEKDVPIAIESLKRLSNAVSGRTLNVRTLSPEAITPTARFAAVIAQRAYMREHRAASGFLLRFRGLPFTDTEESVRQWIASRSGAVRTDQVLSVQLTRNSSKIATGNAFVRFSSFDAQLSAEQQLNGKLMGDRFIEVMLTTVHDMEQIIQAESTRSRGSVHARGHQSVLQSAAGAAEATAIGGAVPQLPPPPSPLAFQTQKQLLPAYVHGGRAYAVLTHPTEVGSSGFFTPTGQYIPTSSGGSVSQPHLAAVPVAGFSPQQQLTSSFPLQQVVPGLSFSGAKSGPYTVVLQRVDQQQHQHQHQPYFVVAPQQQQQHPGLSASSGYPAYAPSAEASSPLYYYQAPAQRQQVQPSQQQQHQRQHQEQQQPFLYVPQVVTSPPSHTQSVPALMSLSPFTGSWQQQQQAHVQQLKQLQPPQQPQHAQSLRLLPAAQQSRGPPLVWNPHFPLILRVTGLTRLTATRATVSALLNLSPADNRVLFGGTPDDQLASITHGRIFITQTPAPANAPQRRRPSSEAVEDPEAQHVDLYVEVAHQWQVNNAERLSGTFHYRDAGGAVKKLLLTMSRCELHELSRALGSSYEMM